MPYARTGLARLFVQGEAPSAAHALPVTFWHCLLGDSSIWHAQAQRVASRASVILVDGPSHGRSGPLRRMFTLEECADAWVEALDEVGVTEPAVFCGLSWGSKVALRVALRHPERVRGLVLFSAIATRLPRSGRGRFFALAQAVRFAGIGPWLGKLLAEQMVESRRDRARDLLGHLQDKDREALHYAIRSVARGQDIIDQLWQIRVPTMLVAGREDRLTPPSCARKIKNAVDGAKLEVLDGVGHLSTIEAPDRTSDLVECFVAEVAAGVGSAQKAPIQPTP